MRLTVAQFPNQIGIDRSEKQFAIFRALTSPRHVVQNPFDFRARKIWIDDESRGLFDVWLKSFVLKDIEEVPAKDDNTEDGE